MSEHDASTARAQATWPDHQARDAENERDLPARSTLASDARADCGAWVLAVGFSLFGLALGELTGFSVTSGTSHVVLTSLFTFVGGVLLSYAGFRRTSGSTTPDALLVGLALGGFSLGLMVGAPGGVFLRCNRYSNAWFAGEPVEHSACLPAAQQAKPELALRKASPVSGAGLMQSTSSGCSNALRAMTRQDAPVERGTLDKLVHELIVTCGLPSDC